MHHNQFFIKDRLTALHIGYSSSSHPCTGYLHNASRCTTATSFLPTRLSRTCYRFSRIWMPYTNCFFVPSCTTKLSMASVCHILSPTHSRWIMHSLNHFLTIQLSCIGAPFPIAHWFSDSLLHATGGFSPELNFQLYLQWPHKIIREWTWFSFPNFNMVSNFSPTYLSVSENLLWTVAAPQGDSRFHNGLLRTSLPSCISNLRYHKHGHIWDPGMTWVFQQERKELFLCGICTWNEHDCHPTNEN